MVRTKKSNVNGCKYLSQIRTFSFGFTTGDVLWIIFPWGKNIHVCNQIDAKRKGWETTEREREKGRDCVLRGGVDV